MANVNKVFLIGNLTAEPEIRQLPSGDTIASFSLAMNRRYTNARGEQVEDTTFVEIDAFSRLADIIRQFVHKGDPLFVEGRLRQDRWVDKQTNQQRSRLKVVADNLQLLSSRPAGAPAGGDGAGYAAQPQYRQQYQQPQYGQAPQPQQYAAPQYGQAPQQPSAPPQYRPAAPQSAPAPMPSFQPQPPPATDAPVDDVPF
ncbi:MAG: single-stranded DNA-binding protein [Victivallales bacterium]|nr:single-stranded DNA-binding protein [Victivallales bacterium]